MRIDDQLARELHIARVCFDDADNVRCRQWAQHFARELAREAGRRGRPARERQLLMSAVRTARQVAGGAVPAIELAEVFDRVLAPAEF